MRHRFYRKWGRRTKLIPILLGILSGLILVAAVGAWFHEVKEIEYISSGQDSDFDGMIDPPEPFEVVKYPYQSWVPILLVVGFAMAVVAVLVFLRTRQSSKKK